LTLSNLATPARFFTARIEVPEMTTLCAGFEREEPLLDNRAADQVIEAERRS
jgi:hypothetical protein